MLAYRRVLVSSGSLGPLGLFGEAGPSVAMPAAAQPRAQSSGHINPAHAKDMMKKGWTPEKLRAVFGNG